MSDKAAITGQVAQILNSRELIVNRGTDHGVEEGMRFAVLAAAPLTVVDPETNETIGAVDQEKVRVEVKEVQARLSICSTYQSRTVGGSLNPMASLETALGPRRTVYRTLRAADDSLPTPLAPAESYVKIGDRVKEIEDDQG